MQLDLFKDNLEIINNIIAYYKDHVIPAIKRGHFSGDLNKNKRKLEKYKQKLQTLNKDNHEN